MKIIRVAYRKLESGPNFSNTAVEAEGTVDEHESPEAALSHLRFWVQAQMGLARGENPKSEVARRLRDMADGLDAELPF